MSVPSDYFNGTILQKVLPALTTTETCLIIYTPLEPIPFSGETELEVRASDWTTAWRRMDELLVAKFFHFPVSELEKSGEVRRIQFEDNKCKLTIEKQLEFHFDFPVLCRVYALDVKLLEDEGEGTLEITITLA